MRFRSLFTLTILWGVSLGSSAGSLPETEGLEVVKNPATIEIIEPLYWSIKKTGRYGYAQDGGVVPGTYLAEKENALGTFYKGPKRAYFWLMHEWTTIWSVGPPKLLRFEGGIWISKVDGRGRVYYIDDPDVSVNPQVLAGPVEVQSLFSREPTSTNTNASSAELNASIAGLQIVQSVLPNLSPLSNGVGSAVASGIIGGILEANRGQIRFSEPQVADPEFRDRIKTIGLGAK